MQKHARPCDNLIDISEQDGPSGTSSEETTEHGTSEVAGETTGGESAVGDVRSLAELVAARESESIGDGKDDSNNCTQKVSHVEHPPTFTK